MAKKGFIAIGLPAPGDVKGKGKDYPGDEPESPGDAEDEDADRAAGVSAMSDFLKILGIKGADPEKALDAYKDLMEHC